MKRKFLLLLVAVASNVLVQAQFTSGVVPLGTTGMTVKLDTSPTTVTLTLTGDTSTRFLGIGFGNSGMAAGADGFIFNKASTANTNLDYTFNGVGVVPTADTSQDWTITSSTGVGTTSTTIVATRTLSGSVGDNALTNASGSIDIFFAKGPSSVSTPLAYHGSANRGYATLNMSVLGTEENLALSKKITPYPNPSKDMVHFKNYDKIKNIKIFDASGKLMLIPKLGDKNAINISSLKSGNYYLEIENTDGQKSFEKLIKE